MKKLLVLMSIVVLALFVGCAGKKDTVKHQAGGQGGDGSQTQVSEGQMSKWNSDALNQEKLKEEELRRKQELQALQSQIEKFSQRDVHFDFDEYKIKSDDIPYLEELGAWLKNHSNLKITIEGHCDERGSDLYNLALGQKRASSVRDFFKMLGIEGNRVDCVSFGEERPLDPGHSESAWSKNRRAHFVIK